MVPVIAKLFDVEMKQVVHGYFAEFICLICNYIGHVNVHKETSLANV